MTRQFLFCSALALGVTAVTTSAMAVTVTFGSGNDGLGGFTQTAGSATEIWTTQTGSVQYRNQDNGTKNSSFLGEFVLDRSSGNAYTITGVVTLTDGYADDNNRVGMYLFGDAAAIINEDEEGALGLIFNTDDGAGGTPDDNVDDRLQIREGIDVPGGVYAQEDRSQTITPFAQDLFGTQVTMTADLVFIGDDLLVGASLTTFDGEVTTVAPVTLAAADYTGDYFGFVTRARARNYVDGVAGTPGGRSVPWVMDYESFSIDPPAILPGDVNEDGAVDLDDLGKIRENLFETEVNGLPVTLADGDANQDGVVNQRDYRLWKAFSTVGAAPLFNAVPEPASLGVGLLGAIALLGLRRRLVSTSH